MANQSIFAAFERMWQHIIIALNGKADAEHNHNDIYYTESEIDSTINNKMNIVNPTGTGSFSLNRKNGTIIGNNSFAEGYNTTASGEYSHAEGHDTTASQKEAHAEGQKTIASGQTSHAEGCFSVASGVNSHAEGYGTNATTYYTHAEGYCTKANGEASHAEGTYTIASNNDQHVQGKYNIADTATDENKMLAHIVGNGTNENTGRSNAHTLDWSGNAWFSGEVYVGSTSGTNKDNGSKKLATEEFVNNLIGNILNGAS